MDIPWNVSLFHGTVGCDGQSHCPMGPWDGQWDTHASVEGQVDIPWTVPWDCGMGWTIYGVSGHLWHM